MRAGATAKPAAPSSCRFLVTPTFRREGQRPYDRRSVGRASAGTRNIEDDVLASRIQPVERGVRVDPSE